ncbi:MAG: PAS domain-containing protein [Deltaproteobacteria bacterium]|nr:PAS domain-containing protein [Deltaproteobacteria bacterium]
MAPTITPNIGVEIRSWHRMFLLSLVILGGLFIISRYNYLLFHSLAEGFSIVIACAIFVIAWNARSMLQNNYLLFVGIAYLFVGGLDFLHTLAYQGMQVFPGHDANLPTQLWVGARFIESLSLLIALLFIHRRLRTAVAFTAYAAVMVVLLLAVFRWNIFPDCFMEQKGLTAFKKISEYTICVIFLIAGGLLFFTGNAFDRNVRHLLMASALVSIGVELSFTLYTDVYGLFNLVGHFLKIVSFYLIYRAVIVTGIKKPHAVLFRDLQQNEAFLNSVVMSSLSGLYIYDIKAKMNTFINPQYTRLTGYTLDDISQMGELNFFNLFHPKDRAGIAAHWDIMRKAEDGEIHEIEYRFKTATGRWIWCISRDTVFKRTKDHSARQFIGSFLDITEWKEAERKLKQARDELQQRVRDRTAVLRWRNRELREFAYVASHDLQEPLRKIQTFGEMLEREASENLSTKSRDYLHRMNRAAYHMQTLVQNLLAYSRLSSNAQPYVPTDLLEIVQKARDNLELKIEETGASITIGALPTIDADPIQMIQLFQNLISNALSFHRDDHPPNLHIYSISEQAIDDASSGYLEIRVQDNGIGFDEKYLEQIFKPFKRLHTRQAYEGTGMGLSICRKIVERHGGDITARSTPGQGATFMVRLPFVQKKGGHFPTKGQ